MPAPILIVGQGLAGSVLAWELAREGVEFLVADAGHETASSRIGAGIINPITGQRLVKSWRIDEWLPSALETYRAMEAAWGMRFLRSMRVRRLFADEREKRIFSEKFPRGDLAPYASGGDDEGFWIEGAARVDTALLIAAARHWLRASGRLVEERVQLADALRAYHLVVLCTGVSPAMIDASGFGFAGMRPAKGEILTLAVDELLPDVILNCGHWILPVAPGRAWIGATFEPGRSDFAPTPAARAELERSAARILGRACEVVAHDVGLRMTSADKHPVVGRSVHDPRLGIFNGLGSKGALLAPRLARQWVNHLTEAVPFDADVSVARFLP